MFNVCPACGTYCVEKAIDPAGPFAICPHCGHRHRFVRLPLFVVTGASGAGKTTLCLELTRRLATGYVVLEGDILWGPEFDKSGEGYRSFWNLWLRMAKNISQAGRPVVWCGTTVPENFESSPERRYFSASHYLALVCDDDVLGQRLRERPSWRQSSAPEFVERMLQFNRWLKENADRTNPPMSLLDTGRQPVVESVERVAEWLGEWRG